jgi:hypothetical protein
MSKEDQKNKANPENSKSDITAEKQVDDSAPGEIQSPKEIGGRGGLDPTRYGDWEKAGRCVDF